MKPLLLTLLLGLPQVLYAATPSLEGQANATWAGSIFFRGFDPTSREKLTDEKLAGFASRLELNGIRYAYVFAGPYQKDGHLPEYAFSPRARQSVEFLKRANPNLKILPWIGGVEGKTVFVEDPEWVKNAMKDTARLMASAPFDGVHIDLEYVLFPKKSASLDLDRYDAEWVEFHRRLRDALPRAFISTVVVSSAPGTRPWKHKHAVKDLTEVSRVVDQVAFMFYETSLHDAGSYRDNLRLQLEQIKEMKSKLGDRSPEYLLAIGTFKSTRALKTYRDVRFENVAFTLTNLTELLPKVSPSQRLIDGVAVYCDWLTTPEDWEQFRANWVNRKP